MRKYKLTLILFCLLLLPSFLVVAENTHNEVFEEISSFLTVPDLKKELDETGTLTSSGEMCQTFSYEDLEMGRKEYFNRCEPWNMGCLGFVRNYNPKYSPFVLDYEAKLALMQAKEAGQALTPEEEVWFSKAKKEELATQSDQQAHEATGLAILDLTATPTKGLRAGNALDIISVFKNFNNYANMISGVFKDSLQLTPAHFEERGLRVDEIYNKKAYYQTSRIMMGIHPIHQTLVYNVTHDPETGIITMAWKIDRRFNDPLGFKQFKFTEKVRNPNNPRERIDIPVFDMQKKEFIPSWLEKNMIFFPSEEYFERWKTHLLADEARLNAWARREILINNNQMGAQDIHEYVGFLKIEPYAPHKYLITHHIYLRLDPTDRDFDFRNRGREFERLRTGFLLGFIDHTISGLRKSLEEIRK